MNRFRYGRLLGQSTLLTNHKSGNIIMGITPPHRINKLLLNKYEVKPLGWIKPADLGEVSAKWTLSSGWNWDHPPARARLWLKSTFNLKLKYCNCPVWQDDYIYISVMDLCVWKCHLVDVKLRLASGHFSVAGAELADKVVPVKVDTKSRSL